MNASSLRTVLIGFLLLAGIQTSCEKKSTNDFQRGMEHFKAGDFDLAIWSWNIHLRKNPGHAEAYAHRGAAKNSKGDPDGAFADFDRALELNPNLAWVYVQRGVARAQRGDASGALDDLGSGIELEPKNSDAYYYRANILTEEGDFDGAIADYTRALQFEPTETLNYFNRGIAHYLRKDWARARSDFDAAARQQNPQLYGLLYSCVLGSRLGQGATARDELRARLPDPGDSEPDEWFSTLASFLLGERDESALLAAAHRGGLAQARNQLCEAWYFAGMARLFAEQETDAILSFRQSIGTGRRNYAEHAFATAELEAIEGKTKRPTEVNASPVPVTVHGKVQQVSRTTISLRDRKGGRVRSFALQQRALVTLDGNGVSIERIKLAMDVTVTLDANGTVKSIEAASRK